MGQRAGNAAFLSAGVFHEVSLNALRSTDAIESELMQAGKRRSGTVREVVVGGCADLRTTAG